MKNWEPKEVEFHMVPYFFPSQKFLICYSVEGLGNFKGFGEIAVTVQTLFYTDVSFKE